jgi:hypothetical protein
MKVFSQPPEKIVVVVCETSFVFIQLLLLRLNNRVQIDQTRFLLLFMFFLNDNRVHFLARCQAGRVLSFQSTFLYRNCGKNLNDVVTLQATN